MDPGIYNQTYDLPQGNINNSIQNDTFFLSLSRSISFSGDQKQDFGLWAFYYDARPSSVEPNFQLGPGFDLYYRFKNPNGFSLGSEVQLFLRSQSRPFSWGPYSYTYFTGPLAPESHNSRGPRVYINPSFTTGDVSWEGQVNYVFPNDYPVMEFYSDGGGWLLGIGPLWRIHTGTTSMFKLLLAFNEIILKNAAYTAYYVPTDIFYNVIKLGVGYEVDF